MGGGGGQIQWAVCTASPFLSTNQHAAPPAPAGGRLCRLGPAAAGGHRHLLQPQQRQPWGLHVPCWHAHRLGGPGRAVHQLELGGPSEALPRADRLSSLPLGVWKAHRRSLDAPWTLPRPLRGRRSTRRSTSAARQALDQTFPSCAPTTPKAALSWHDCIGMARAPTLLSSPLPITGFSPEWVRHLPRGQQRQQ